MSEFIEIQGVSYVKGDYPQAIRLLSQGRLMVVPAAPALATIDDDKEYHQALLDADFAIPDSGFMLLVLRLFKRVSLKKLSGLEFLRKFLGDKNLDLNKNLFLIDPSADDQAANREYLKSIGIELGEGDSYIAPFYKGDYKDFKLLGILNERRPKFIMINLGGGVQEKLGAFLKANLDEPSGIICTGAAIAFLTGRQAPIPDIVDKLYLGWFYRCVSDYRVFVPRYLSAFRLFGKLLKEEVRRDV